MLFKPLFEEPIGKEHLDPIGVDAAEAEGAKPGGETVVDQLPLDIRKGGLPNFLG